MTSPLLTSPRLSGSIPRTPTPIPPAARLATPEGVRHAIADYTEAIRLDPHDAAAYLNRGRAWNIKKEHDKAMADYTEGIRLDPQNVRAYLLRGHTWVEKKEYDKAIADYTEAIRLNPQFAEAYYAWGNAWLAKDEYDRAIAGFAEAIRLDPKNAFAYLKRGLACARKEGVREGDRRLHRGHPARSEIRPRLRGPRRCVASTGAVRQGNRRRERGQKAQSQMTCSATVRWPAIRRRNIGGSEIPDDATTSPTPCVGGLPTAHRPPQRRASAMLIGRTAEPPDVHGGTFWSDRLGRPAPDGSTCQMPRSVR